MTSWVVADSGIYLALSLEEEVSPQAKALTSYWMTSDFNVAAPYLFWYEITSTIRKHIARATISLPDGREALKGLLAQPVHTFTDELLLERAFEIATRFGRPAAYDSTYLALAEHLGCEFWTADRRLINVVGSTLTWVKWVGNFPLSENE